MKIEPRAVACLRFDSAEQMTRCAGRARGDVSAIRLWDASIAFSKLGRGIAKANHAFMEIRF